MRQTSKFGEHRTQCLGSRQRLGLKLEALVTQTADDDAASFAAASASLVRRDMSARSFSASAA